MPGVPVHHQLPEFIQTHVHRVSDAIQPSHPLLSPSLLPPIPPSIRVFSNESTLCMRWPKYWSFSFSIIPSKEPLSHLLFFLILEKSYRSKHNLGKKAFNRSCPVLQRFTTFFSFVAVKQMKFCCCCSVTQSCLTLCDLMDYTVHGILQARILEWVAVPFSRVSS